MPNSRIDGKTLYQITGKTYYESLIKEYYSMLNSNNKNSKHLYVPKISSISGKVFGDSKGSNMESDYINNIKMAKLLNISKFNEQGDKKNPKEESYRTEVDFKYKEIITNDNGIDDFIEM